MHQDPNGTGTFLTHSTATVFVCGAVFSEVLELFGPLPATAGFHAVRAVKPFTLGLFRFAGVEKAVNSGSF